jgi:D-amino acid aminotransferase
MTAPLAWVDGDLVPLDQARVSVLDRGFRTGEGVFETLRVYGDHPFRLDAHLDRALAGALRLAFDAPPRADLRTAVTELIAANRGAFPGDSGLRLTVTPGVLDPLSAFPGAATGSPTVVATLQALAIDPRIHTDGIRAMTVRRARELPQVKAVSYAAANLARREARRAGADEALLVADDDTVLEGAASNLFVLVGGHLATPPVDAGILAGVTRAVVLEVAAEQGLAVEQRRLSLDDVLAADEVFVTASTREVVPVAAIDGRPVGGGRPGPRTRSLLAAYRAEVARERAG